jgi:hypothetical protein
MKIGIVTVGLDGIYPQLVARMIQRFAAVSPGYFIQAFVNTLPPGAPRNVVDGYDYSGYCSKPFALDSLRKEGYEIGIWLDASFYPVRDILPIAEHIRDTGYYFCDNEAKVGEWCSDACQQQMGVTRDVLWEMPELSSYCIGFDFRRGECVQLLEQFKSAAYSDKLFPGRHTAGTTGRNPGFVSTDPRVKGHRFDQTVLSIQAHQFGMTNFVKRPRFTAYAAREWNAHHIAPTAETVLVNWGKLDVKFD